MRTNRPYDAISTLPRLCHHQSRILFAFSFLLLSVFSATPGQVLASSIVSQPDVRKYNLALGRNVFEGKCVSCHANVDSEAPQLHNLPDWKQRIGISLDSLISHALNGHGKMPPKGGYAALTDREVSAAVAYVVDHGRRLMIRSNGEISLNAAEFCGNPDSDFACSNSQVDNTLLLQMLWIITGKKQQM